MIKLEKTIKYSICAGAAFIALAGASPAHAVSFLSTLRDGPDGSGNFGNSHVGTIDPTTGIYTDFITTEIQLTDIAVNTTGALYGITYDQLYKLPAGTQTQQFVGDLDVAVDISMNALGFDKKNDLYAAGNDGFYSVSIADGKATQLGSSITNFFSAGDIVYNPLTNQFLATSQLNEFANSFLFSIGLDGTATQIGDIGTTNVFGLAFEGGNLLGYTQDKKQIKINLGTGAGIFNQNISGTTLLIGGSASSPTSGPTAVPEPSFLPGFVVLGACLGARSLANRRKSQKPID